MALRILFADDSMTAQNMGKKILTDAGHQVTAVSNGAAALKKISELKPEIVVLDVYMPGYNGLEVCEKIRSSQETANIPVLLTVGKMEPYKPEDGARVKADGIIVKPFEASDLLAAIEKLSERLHSAPTASVAPAVQAPSVQEPEFDAEQAEAHEAHSDRAPSAVTVPSEMASHAAFGFEDMLGDAAASAPESSAAVEAPAEDNGSAAVESYEVAAESSDVAEAQVDGQEFAIESGDAAGEFQIDSAASSTEESVQSSSELDPPYASTSDSDEASALHASNGFNAQDANAIAPDPMVERFDIGSDEFSVEKAAGYEATAADPVPDAPIASEPGFEATSQTADEVVQVISDSAEDVIAEASAIPGLQDEPEVEVPLIQDSSREADTLPEPASASEYSIAFPHSGIPDLESDSNVVQAEGGSEAALEGDDFESRVNAALSSFDAESVEIIEDGSGEEIAPIMIEQDDAGLTASHPLPGHETGDASHTAEFSIEGHSAEHEADMPEIISGEVAETATSQDLVHEIPVDEAERALAAAARAGAHAGLTGEEQASLNPEVISKIVSQVLERSLPEILSQVMSEMERERKK